jgi:hypothetical protein
VKKGAATGSAAFFEKSSLRRGWLGGRKKAMAATKRGYGAFLPLFVRAGVVKTTVQ